jgi:hypothetical protein
MKDLSEQPVNANDARRPSAHPAYLVKATVTTPDQDDRYPGSFFRIPGQPMPGKTTWSIN